MEDGFCISCKNQQSSERCPRKKKEGSQFCGHHQRMRHKRIWACADIAIRPITRLQAIFRGRRQRQLDRLHGDGYLNSKHCMNDSEIVSGDSIHEMDREWYFSIKDNNHIYWFDIRNLMAWTFGKLTPTNPYTRGEISSEDLYRMRKLSKLLGIKHSTNLLKEHISKLTDNQEKAWGMMVDLIRRFYELGFDSVKIGWFLEMPASSRHFLTRGLADIWYSLPQKTRDSYTLRKSSPDYLYNLFGKYRWYSLSQIESDFRFAEVLGKFMNMGGTKDQDTSLALLLLQMMTSVSIDCAMIYG